MASRSRTRNSWRWALPADPQEDGNRFNDINKRIVIRATGFGPRNTQVQLEQMLMPIKMPALLVNGNLEMAGNAQVIGSQGSVHANGDLLITGNAVTITENATASGTLTAGSGWDPGELESGGMPVIPVPDIHASDYFSDADFVLQANGRITNKAGTTIYCNASANANACRNVTPPGGTASVWLDLRWLGLGSVPEQRQLGDVLRADGRAHYRQPGQHGPLPSC